MMQSASDPIVCEPKGYQTIESGYTGPAMEMEKTMFSQVREAREQSQGFCDFCLIFCSLMISSIIWTLFMAIIITVPLAMIVIGAVNFHDCGVEKMIPIFNIVAGSVLTLSNVLHMVCHWRRRAEGTARPKGVAAISWINALLQIFLFIWFFAGCYWVYHVHRPDETQCDPTLYSFTFWLVSATFMLFGTIAVASAVGFCLALICW